MKKYLLAGLLLAGCQQRDNTKRVESGITFVGRYEITEGGMRYVLYREVDGGLFIINVTKDSMETEVAKFKIEIVR